MLHAGADARRCCASRRIFGATVQRSRWHLPSGGRHLSAWISPDDVLRESRHVDVLRALATGADPTESIAVDCPRFGREVALFDRSVIEQRAQHLAALGLEIAVAGPRFRLEKRNRDFLLRARP